MVVEFNTPQAVGWSQHVALVDCAVAWCSRRFLVQLAHWAQQ